MSRLPRFFLNEITDRFIRRNFELLRDFFRTESPMLGFKHFSITFTGNVAHYQTPHKLGFLPKDILVTSQVGVGTVTWHYDEFTEDLLDLTVSGMTGDELTIRFFAGTYNSGAA